MMTKFKAGDKIKVGIAYGNVNVGDILTISKVKDDWYYIANATGFHINSLIAEKSTLVKKG